MKSKTFTRLAVIAAAAITGGTAQGEINDQVRASIDQLTSAKGAYTAEEDVYRVSFPRSDLKVTIENRPAHPFLGFSSWAAFTPSSHGGSMVMGDIVLLQDEVSPAMSAALHNGLEVTALHNHFFYESSRVMYIHIGGSGDPNKLASAVKKVIDAQRAVRSGAPDPPNAFSGGQVPATNSITAGPLDQILGVKGETNSGMYKATIGRRTAKHHGKTIGVARPGSRCPDVANTPLPLKTRSGKDLSRN